MIYYMLIVLLVLSAKGFGDFRSSPLSHSRGYSYSWKVLDTSSGNDFGHRENRAFKGPSNDVTEGEYFVRLPDGRLQTVIYSVDPFSGFRARVIYDRGPSPIDRNPKALTAPISPQPRTSSKPRFTLPQQQPLFRKKSQKLRSESVSLPAYYTPTSYEAVNVSQASAPVVNLVVPDWERPARVVVTKYPTIRPLSPPPQKESQDHKKDDPFYKTESELKGYDFSDPFFYPYTKKISKDSGFKGRSDMKHDHHSL